MTTRHDFFFSSSSWERLVKSMFETILLLHSAKFKPESNHVAVTLKRCLIFFQAKLQLRSNQAQTQLQRIPSRPSAPYGKVKASGAVCSHLSSLAKRRTAVTRVSV